MAKNIAKEPVYKRTIYNRSYIDWSTWMGHSKVYFDKPLKPFCPPEPHRRFRPMPEPAKDEPEPDRIKVHEPRGLKTPDTAFCYGYRHFHRDPSEKKLRPRSITEENPMPHPLSTIYRSSFQSPFDFPHKMFLLNTSRYGLPPNKKAALGIVPETISIPHPLQKEEM